MRKQSKSRDPFIGAVIGKVRIEKCLGIGGMGSVYQGQHVYLKKTVALKILHNHLTHEARNIKRFFREATATSKLDSPYIIKVEDTGYDEKTGVYYIRMEYVEGKNLSEKLKKEKFLGIKAALKYLDQAAKGLEVAHKKNIFHRDIKPANIMIDKQDNVKIGDFGLAKIFESNLTQLTESEQFMGTACYMAPEQFTERQTTSQTEIYALGVTFYQMITGELPFEAPTPLGFGMKKCSQNPPSPKEVMENLPQVVNKLTLKMIAMNPKKRYASIAELRKAISKTKIQVMTKGYPAKASQKSKRRERKNCCYARNDA